MLAFTRFTNTAAQGVVLVVDDLLELFCAVFYLKLFYTGQLLAVVVVVAGLQFLSFTAELGDAVAMNVVAVVRITAEG
ncbi:hypothetical protein GCM10027180_31280 [Microbulbifer echini]